MLVEHRLFSSLSDSQRLVASQSAVTALRFNATGAMLASGAKDTDVILWDVIGETGMFRLRGHHDQASKILAHKALQLGPSLSNRGVPSVWQGVAVQSSPLRFSEPMR